MKKISLKYSKDSELTECVNSAYDDLQILLQDAFINVSKFPHQLTYDQFFSLFESYDWQNIFNQFEQLENLTDFGNVESLFSTIIGSLKADSNTIPLTNPRENTYYKVWAGSMTDEDF
jgi:hypothetical protein